MARSIAKEATGGAGRGPGATRFPSTREPGIGPGPRGRRPPARAPAAALLALALALAAGPAARAEPARVTLPAPGTEAWEPRSFRGVERETRYVLEHHGDGAVLRARAECAASALVLPLEGRGIDLARTPRLRWRWRVDEAPAVSDPTRREGDDFGARVYVLFPPDPERETWWEGARRRLVSGLYGEALPGEALNYVWSAAAPPGGTWRNPFAPRNAMLALRGDAAETGSWHEEEVDVASDFRRVFDAEPGAPMAVAVMSDSDQTCSTAAARYADFAFVAGRN